MKTIFITGISRGLGLSMTRHFLSQGNRVIGLSRTCSSELAELLDNYPDTLIWQSFDLLKTADIDEKLCRLLPLQTERIDVFIDNAAVALQNLLHNADNKKIADLLTINSVAPMLLTKLVINNFLRHRVKGVIIHLSSICAHKAYMGLSVLGASKAALEAFSRTVAAEYGRFGIRSNTIVAGLVNTGMFSLLDNRQELDFKKNTALRTHVDAQAVIDMVDFLISDKADKITGQNIHVNAGIL